VLPFAQNVGGGLSFCVAAGLFVLRADHFVHNSSWAPLLGRLGTGSHQ